jgi:hypothetical protein
VFVLVFVLVLDTACGIVGAARVGGAPQVGYFEPVNGVSSVQLWWGRDAK